MNAHNSNKMKRAPSIHTGPLPIIILILIIGISSIGCRNYPEGGSGDEIIGIGVMGDSNSDEYHANDNRGGKYADTTFSWVEILVQARDLNFGAWGSWDKPRRDGYEYNWARSGATTGSMITSGQHTGIAQQVADGKVSHVLIYIGANDFNIVSGQYQEIYDNSLSDAALQTKVEKIIADMTTAMDTVSQAGDVKIVIVSFHDPGISPLAKTYFTDADKRQRVTNAIQDVNEGIKIAAAERGISVVDIDAFGLQVLAEMDEDGYIEFGGEMINALEYGNEPHHLQLGERFGHFGTIASGIIANELFIKPFNSAYRTQIRSLSEREILEIAGISGIGSLPQKFPYRTSVYSKR
jgi:phospholipase/lecithinase/hemolysin